MLITSIVFRILPVLLGLTEQDLISEEPHTRVHESSLDIYVTKQKNHKVDISYFPVYGETPSEVRNYLTGNGFVGKDNVHYDAYTEWQIRWKWPLRNKKPDLKKAEVEISVNVHLPEWKTSLPPSDPVYQSWLKYLGAVKAHEYGHVRQALHHKEKLEREFSRIATSGKPFSSKEANKLAAAIIREAQATDELYDFLTKHGAYQGAKWPG